jgi:hypothetical protein
MISPENFKIFVQNFSIPLAVVSAVAAGFWAVFTYHRTMRLQTADFLVKLENSFSNHFDIIIEIDYHDLYKSKYKPVLVKLYPSGPNKRVILTKEDHEILAPLEKALRHMYVAYVTRSLIMKKYIPAFDKAYKYYVTILCDADVRPDLVKYINEYWRFLQHWKDQLPA